MLLHFLRGVRRPAHALIKPAQLIVNGRMLRFKLADRFKLRECFLNVAEFFLRQTHLEIQRRDGRINVLGLLKRLDRRLGLVQTQIRAAHQIIGRRAVVIEIQRLLRVFDDIRGVARQQIRVGQIQTGVETFRRERRRFQVSGDGVGDIALFKKAVAARHQLRERVGAFRLATFFRAGGKEHQQQKNRDAGDNPK